MRSVTTVAATLMVVLLAAGAVLFVAGCAEAKHASIPGLAIPPHIKFKGLERNHYEIVTTAKGEGCATFYGLFPLPIFWIDAENIRADVYGFYPGSISREIATFKAIQSVPDADALFWPRFSDKIEAGGIWYYKVCSTVIGKAIRFKTDGQAVQAPAYPTQQYQQPQYAPQPAPAPVPYPPPAAPGGYQPMVYPPQQQPAPGQHRQ
ncbi:MAG: hypothetical protein HY897_24750 [Deltaproteobacteria bacterium]|nr:hypothetical protein [Deltaproteobacteria bacterium]